MNLDFIDSAPNKYPRGETRVGHQGWVAWIDDGSKVVHCQEGRCFATSGGTAQIRTNDGEYALDVPHGRLQCNRLAALDALAADLREEAEREMASNDSAIERVYEKAERAATQIRLKCAENARNLLMLLVAVEMAKANSKDPETLKELGESLKRIGQQPA